MEPRSFLQQHKLFRVDKFEAATGLSGSKRKASLDYHRKRGHILPVRRGLYWIVQPGGSVEDCPVDPFLVAGHVSADAALAYHSALELYGRAYSSFHEIQFLTGRKIRPFEFRGVQYRPVGVPPALGRAGREDLGIQSIDRGGETLKVTTLERSLVDALDRPELCGGWEEVWRSLELIEYLDIGLVCRYVHALGNATTAAKTGWFLQENRQRLMVDDDTLDKLQTQRPAMPHYIDRGSHEPGRFLSRWNLIVPASLADRSWVEPA